MEVILLREGKLAIFIGIVLVYKQIRFSLSNDFIVLFEKTYQVKTSDTICMLIICTAHRN